MNKVKFEAQDIVHTINNCLVALCKLRRVMDTFSTITISSKLQDFNMLDKLSIKLQEVNALEHLQECHQLMANIVKELLPWHNQIFLDKPEYKEIFTTFMMRS